MRYIGKSGTWHLKQDGKEFVAWQYTKDGTDRVTARSLMELEELLG